jgi:hypothetical protein
VRKSGRKSIGRAGRGQGSISRALGRTTTEVPDAVGSRGARERGSAAAAACVNSDGGREAKAAGVGVS